MSRPTVHNEGKHQVENIGDIRYHTTRTITQPLLIENNKERCPVHDRVLLTVYFLRGRNGTKSQKLPFKLCPRCFE